MRESVIVRPTLPLDTSGSDRFVVSKPSFAPQYAHVYFCRLCQLREAALSAGLMRWGPESDTLKYANRIADIRAGSATNETVVVGVLFREMQAKPSILRQYSVVSNELIPDPPSRSATPYSADGDALSIEDENGRCTLDVSRLPARTRVLATGAVVAVRGFEDTGSGCFVVTSVAVPGPAPQRALRSPAPGVSVAFVSGLALGGGAGALAVELLLEFLRGNVGGGGAEHVALLVVAGGLLAPDRDALCVRDTQRAVVDAARTDAAAPLVEADRFLTAVASVIPVIVLPGEHDPANYTLPQQPLHRCLLPSASRSANLHRLPNPAAADAVGRILLGSAGQPVTDLALYGELPPQAPAGEDSSAADELLDCMETMLDTRHIAPTCPDTLAAYPFAKEDPFAITETPHVFFAGNQPQFASRMYRRKVVKVVKEEDSKDAEDVETRIVCVPKFSETGRIVLVNLENLECSVQEFGCTV